jgi:hypothetical protein
MSKEDIIWCLMIFTKMKEHLRCFSHEDVIKQVSEFINQLSNPKFYEKSY